MTSDDDIKQTPAEEREEEQEAVREASHLSAKLVYQVVRREGIEELRRPNTSLIWSGVAAGICISFSVLGEAVLRTHLPDTEWLHLVESLGYTFGFLIVILGRLQLFTENTLTTVLPLLAKPTAHVAWAVARLWAIVLAANVVGAFIAGTFIAYTGVFDADMLVSVQEISEHATGAGPLLGLLKAIPAGLLVAALVWMLSAGEQDNFFIIVVMTWLIAAGDFTHVIAGSVEMAYLVVTGNLGLIGAVFGFFLPVLIGNIIGGTAVFTLMAWGQVREEVKHAS